MRKTESGAQREVQVVVEVGARAANVVKMVQRHSRRRMYKRKMGVGKKERNGDPEEFVGSYTAALCLGGPWFKILSPNGNNLEFDKSNSTRIRAKGIKQMVTVLRASS